MIRWRLHLPMVAAVIVLSGCQDPYQQDPVATPRTQSTRPGTPSGSWEPSSTPRQAVDAFCAQWANWTWRTIARQQSRLARMATGPLGRQLTAEARLRAADEALRRDRVGRRGIVVAIDVRGGARSRRAVCVSLEEPIANGRVDPEGARHRVYLATVDRVAGGWAIGRWEPQP